MINVLPTVADVADAYVRLRDWVVETPVLESEAHQRPRRTRACCSRPSACSIRGSFKIRGALNRLLQLSADEREAGVVAFSSGNHAQAVALAAKWLGMRATIVMPADAPKIKLDAHARARRRGRAVRPRARGSRAIAPGIAEQRGAALVPPFDHPHIIAGQGTPALELARAARDAARSTLDALYVPCSGGGLVAGSALAIKSELAGLRRVCGRAARRSRTRRRRSRPASGAGARRRHDALRRLCARRCRARSRSRSIAASSRARVAVDDAADARGDGARGAALEGRRSSRRAPRRSPPCLREPPARSASASASCCRAATSTRSCSPTCSGRTGA